MRKSYLTKMTAYALSLAMVLSGSALSSLTNHAVADAAAKKATVSISSSKLSLTVGQKKTLTIKKKNVKKITSQVWASSKKKVATVTKKGVVTAKKAGSTKITCTLKYTDAASKKAKTKKLTCAVTVKAKVPTPTAAPTVEPTLSPDTQLNDVLEAKDITHRVKSDDTSNIGEEREISIVGGTTEKMKVKDNGTMRKELSSQYLADNEMGLGINLGNTMEATLSMVDKFKTTDVTKFEQAWGAAVTTQKFIDCVHSYGINTLRIPVAWTNMDSEDGTYTISEKYLGRVEEIVNYALNNGMYVVINDHWDNQWWGQFGACKRDENGKKVADEDTRKKAWARYEAYWTQICNRFKDYSDHLIFEGANEELGDRLNDGIKPSTGYVASLDDKEKSISGNLTKDERYATTNAINQKFVDIVRSTGGNNQYRHLLIPGYNTNIQDTHDARFIMPKDPTNADVNKLFVSVHYYTPWDFCGDGGTGDYTVADQEATKTYLSDLQRFVDEGYAVIIGECGVCNPTGVESSVTQWFNDTFVEASKYHAVPCLWDTGEYFDRANAKAKFKDIAILYNTMTGAKGDTSMNRVTGKVKVSDFVDVTGLESKWDWTGKWYKNGGDNTVGDDKFQDNGGTVVTKTKDMTDDDIRALFIPESKVTAKDADDKTEIQFNNWGYQAFIKVDLSKYTLPVISFDFLDGI